MKMIKLENKALKDALRIAGLIFTIAEALFIILFLGSFFTEPRLKDALFDVGIDSIGVLFCAALFFGCMNQSGNGINYLRILIVLVSAGFTANYAMFYTLGVPEQSTICFFLCLASKLLDLVMIGCFFSYLKVTLDFQGKLADLTEKVIFVLLVLETALMLSNIFYPTTFYLDIQGMYQATSFAWAEDIYLAVTSVCAAALIIMSKNPLNQKTAALTFILFPLVEYALMGGRFGNAAQYGTVLMSLVIMYCIIFIDKSKTLAAAQKDLQIASRIQMDALPSAAPEFDDFPELVLRGSINTAKEVGGDFYDYFPIDENRICFLIADVSGKGTPAALFMMKAKTVIRGYALTKDSTAEIFNAVNERLCEKNEEGMFATAWIGILDKRTMTLQYTNAGHNFPILLKKNKPVETMASSHGLFLGGMEFTRYKQDELTLAQGDRLLLYTDGVTEAHNPVSILYGNERLKKIIENTKDEAGEKVLESILFDIDAFVKGAPQFDDITMVILTIKEKQEAARG